MSIKMTEIYIEFGIDSNRVILNSNIARKFVQHNQQSANRLRV